MKIIVSLAKKSMEFLPEAIDQYVQDFTEKESTLLAELSKETYLKVLIPRMLSGHVQGRILSMISQMVQPKYILEIGTYTGYSAICLAEGLKENGELITIDNNEELKTILDKYLLKSPKASKVNLKFGNAIDIIPELKNEIDLVFIDADKENYSNYFHLVIDKVRTGGFILVDNVLWSGKVVGKIDSNDRSTQGILDFNELVHNDERVENVLFPVRDGIMVLRKK